VIPAVGSMTEDRSAFGEKSQPKNNNDGERFGEIWKRTDHCNQLCEEIENTAMELIGSLLDEREHVMRTMDADSAPSHSGGHINMQETGNVPTSSGAPSRETDTGVESEGAEASEESVGMSQYLDQTRLVGYIQTLLHSTIKESLEVNQIQTVASSGTDAVTHELQTITPNSVTNRLETVKPCSDTVTERVQTLTPGTNSLKTVATTSKSGANLAEAVTSCCEYVMSDPTSITPEPKTAIKNSKSLVGKSEIVTDTMETVAVSMAADEDNLHIIVSPSESADLMDSSQAGMGPRSTDASHTKIVKPPPSKDAIQVKTNTSYTQSAALISQTAKPSLHTTEQNDTMTGTSDAVSTKNETKPESASVDLPPSESAYSMSELLDTVSEVLPPPRKHSKTSPHRAANQTAAHRMPKNSAQSPQRQSTNSPSRQKVMQVEPNSPVHSGSAHSSPAHTVSRPDGPQRRISNPVISLGKSSSPVSRRPQDRPYERSRSELSLPSPGNASTSDGISGDGAVSYSRCHHFLSTGAMLRCDWKPANSDPWWLATPITKQFSEH